MDEFEAITAELRAEERSEQVEHAREILAAADATRDYVEVLRRIGPGEVVVDRDGRRLGRAGTGGQGRGRLAADRRGSGRRSAPPGSRRGAPTRCASPRWSGSAGGRVDDRGPRYAPRPRAAARYSSSVSRLTRQTPFFPIFRAGRSPERISVYTWVTVTLSTRATSAGFSSGGGRFVVHRRAGLVGVANRPVGGRAAMRTGRHARGRAELRPGGVPMTAATLASATAAGPGRSTHGSSRASCSSRCR